ncbi:MAG TPA: sigma-70 family RNA polymerase sigma factor [Polyangiaceae bacterium]|nr:sigma-70 family RNA polymerase sigma factor [Polyangiaceae bacterium]
MLSLKEGAWRPDATTAAGPRDELAVLATAVVRGDPGAVRTFVIATGKTVRGAVRMVLGSSPHEIDDVTQDAMIGLLRALPRFRGECTIAQFAGRVAILTAMAARRRKRNQNRWVIADDAETLRAASPESSPLARVEASRRREAFRRLLDELPESIAEAMALYFMLGHTVQEIAAQAQVPVGTVWSRIRIGKARLKRQLARDTVLSEELGAWGAGR